MKKIIKKSLFLLYFLALTTFVNTQTLYRSDYIETFDLDWSGIWWTPIASTNYYTNAFVSSTSSAVLYGVGNGTSAYESDWYSFPNLVVNPNNDYYFTFRLASYRFTSTNATRGVDGADYITVQLSTDGGTNYNNELRITGNANAFWNYNTNASYTKTANGTLTTIGPSTGGDRTSTGDGYSVIRLNIPPNTSNIAIDIFSRANSAGEEWWMDNFQLYEIVNTPLPITLISFEGSKKEDYNLLEWSTASERDNDYFIIERSQDGTNWVSINSTDGMGNSNTKVDYLFSDFTFTNDFNYYRLTQVDFDGLSETFDIILINNSRKQKQILKITNTLGQEVSKDTKGLLIVTYTDGTSEKIMN